MNHDNPLIFLLDFLFDAYIAIMLLRFLLQYLGADFYNPISQFIVKATQKPVFIARRFIPGYRGIDFATLTLVLVLIFIKLTLLYTIGGIQPSAAGIIIRGIYDLVQLVFDIFIFAIIIQAILSWINPDPYNPVSVLLASLTYPVLRPIRKYVPLMGGLDLSPLVAIIGLIFIQKTVLYFFQML